MNHFVETNYISHFRMDQMFAWVKSEGGFYSDYRYFKQVRNDKHLFFAIKNTRLDDFIQKYVEWKNQKRPLFIHEIIANKSTCKLYVDIEQRNVLEQNEIMLPEYISDLKKFIGSEKYLVMKGSRLITKGQRPYEFKWSYHIIFTDFEYEDNHSNMMRIMSSFYENYPKYELWKDLAVYFKQRSMRMLWSQKDDETSRLEFDYNLSTDNHKSLSEIQIMRRSLIVRKSDYERCKHQPKATTFKKIRTEKEVDVGKHCDEFVKKYLAERKGSITKCVGIDDKRMIIQTNCRYCLMKKERTKDPYHKNNYIYLMVHLHDDDEFEITQGCYDIDCRSFTKKINTPQLRLIHASYAESEGWIQ